MVHGSGPASGEYARNWEDIGHRHAAENSVEDVDIGGGAPTYQVSDGTAVIDVRRFR
jgi:hypothetical protein